MLKYNYQLLVGTCPMKKSKRIGLIMFIMGITIFASLMINADNIDNMFPDFFNFLITLASLFMIICGGIKFFSKTVEESLSEMQKTNEENKTLEKYFNHTPYITYIIFAINILVFIILNIFINNDNVILEFSISREYLISPKIYKVISYMFVHSDEVHLLCNMWFLLFFGSKLESLLGIKKFLLLYFISGILSGVVASLFSTYPIIGASGAIYAILGALIIISLINKDKMKMMLSKTLIPMLIYGIIESILFQGVSLSCHLSGALIGILFIIITGKDKYKLK